MDLDMPFPERGLNLASADVPTDGSVAPGLTTDVGKNVRLYEPLTGRARGGQRPGISRYINARVNGVAAIQHLNTVVRTSGGALGWRFLGAEFTATGLYGGLDLSGGVTPTGGGGGFQPSASFNERVHGSLTVSDSTVPADGTTATITFTVLDADGNPAADQITRLHTSQDNRYSDNVTAITNGSGVATFTVKSFVEETVTYLATVEDEDGEFLNRSTNSVQVTYGAITFVQANSVSLNLSGFVASLAFTSNVTTGNLLIVALNDFNFAADIAVSDTLGNTYTFIREASPTLGNGIMVWRAVSTGTGANTVTFTSSGAIFGAVAIGILEYSGQNATPVESSVDGGTLTPTTSFTTGTITVSGSSRLLLGFFSAAFEAAGTLTVGSGYTERCNPTAVAPNYAQILVEEKNGASASEAATATSSPSRQYASVGVCIKP